LKELMLPISEHVNVEKRDKFNQTPLHFASTFNAEKAVAQLIKRGAKLEAANEAGWTALHFAALNGSELSCRVLLEHCANVNAVTELGKTPLMFAASSGFTGVVTQLLTARADTKMGDKYHLTASYYAKRNCRKLISDYETK